MNVTLIQNAILKEYGAMPQFGCFWIPGFDKYPSISTISIYLTKDFKPFNDISYVKTKFWQCLKTELIYMPLGNSSEYQIPEDEEPPYAYLLKNFTKKIS